LLDLYLSGDFAKDMLIERKHQFETTISNHQWEQEEVASLLGSVNYTDQDIVVIEEFCAKIRDNLEHVAFEGKRHILDLLDVHGTLIQENG
jgi:hypothetical protein